MSVLDLFFPRGVKCIFCGCETKVFGICDDCYNNLPIIDSYTCYKCGGRVLKNNKVCIECKNVNFDYDRCFAVLSYENDVQSKILSFKQSGYKYIGYAFAKLIADKYKDCSLDKVVDIIVPMPINDIRLKERGFNQSQVLCEDLLDTGKVSFDLIKRIKDTPHQTGLSRENRKRNLKGCFEVVDKKKVKDKTILIVDDIYTTGSTIDECAKTIKKAGASCVYAICLARAPIKKDNII